MSLPINHISNSANEINVYIDGRRNKTLRSLRTNWEGFNNKFLGGIEPNTLYTIAGRSGSGKSAMVNTLETDLFELNPKANFVVLNFAFEMLSSRMVGRKLSYKLKKTTSELYSGYNKLSDDDYSKVQTELENIKQYPIYYVDTPGTITQIRDTVSTFMQNEGKGKWVIIILDHILLTGKGSGEDERTTVSNLQRLFIQMKKWGMNTIIQLSQLNRGIESVDRVNNRSMHFPMASDLFGADSIMHASDVIVILHRPELLNIPNGKYGPKGFNTENLVYMHIIKNREGDLGYLVFQNNLKHNRLDETILTMKNEMEKAGGIQIDF